GGATRNSSGTQQRPPTALTTASRTNGSPPALTKAFQVACSSAAASTRLRTIGSIERSAAAGFVQGLVVARVEAGPIGLGRREGLDRLEAGQRAARQLLIDRRAAALPRDLLLRQGAHDARGDAARQHAGRHFEAALHERERGDDAR